MGDQQLICLDPEGPVSGEPTALTGSSNPNLGPAGGDQGAKGRTDGSLAGKDRTIRGELRAEGHWEEVLTMAKDPAAADRKPWWKGARGEWFVVAQVVLIGLVFLGPRNAAWLPQWPFPFPQACAVAGVALMLLGGSLFVAGLLRLGPGLTPLPYPKDGAEFVQTGPFALVRHPIYSGGLVLALGWALNVQSWLTLGYVAALFVFLDVKSRREERWLAEKFPAYTAYQRRVRKLIPFVY
jgi:protein-S-isoprenylcysteine O-methyltransferase Ste14